MHEGEASSGTLGGGLASVGIAGLMLAYFCIRSLDVYSFRDPAISSFTISEDRAKMDAPISFGELG